MNKKKTSWVVVLGLCLLFFSGLMFLLHRTPGSTNLPIGPITSTRSNYVSIKYRSDKVDIENTRFEYLNTSSSSLVNGAWYDDSNNYMVINLNGTYYHYCGLPINIWKDFGSASSFGTYYNSNIKGNYDCRYNPVPVY